MSLHIPIRVYFIYFEAKIFWFRNVFEIFGSWYFSNYDTFLLMLFILNFSLSKMIMNVYLACLFCLFLHSFIFDFPGSFSLGVIITDVFAPFSGSDRGDQLTACSPSPVWKVTAQ